MEKHSFENFLILSNVTVRHKSKSAELIFQNKCHLENIDHVTGMTQCSSSNCKSALIFIKHATLKSPSGERYLLRPCKTENFPLRPYQNEYGNS